MKKGKYMFFLATLIMIFCLTGCSSLSMNSKKDSIDNSNTVQFGDVIGQISLGETILDVKEIDGFSDWEFDSYDNDDEYGVRDYLEKASSELYDIEMEIVPEEEADEFVGRAAAYGEDFGRVDYNGDKIVYYRHSSNYTAQAGLFDYIVMYKADPNGYSIRIQVSCGGRYASDYEYSGDGEDDFPKWILENKDSYSSLSTSPESYCFLFDAIE